MNNGVSPEALQTAINTMRDAAGSATRGLPEEVFLLVSRLNAMINVDLLIKDGDGRSLLTWRHDRFYGPGWHIPGGIIRFKETAAARIASVAAGELGATVSTGSTPIRLHEITNPGRDIRGHFISLLYACRLSSPLDETRRFSEDVPRNGAWAWHDHAPDNLIPQQRIYIPDIERSHHDTAEKIRP